MVCAFFATLFVVIFHFVAFMRSNTREVYKRLLLLLPLLINLKCGVHKEEVVVFKEVCLIILPKEDIRMVKYLFHLMQNYTLQWVVKVQMVQEIQMQQVVGMVVALRQI